jgi:hypothetical protein
LSTSTALAEGNAQTHSDSHYGKPNQRKDKAFARNDSTTPELITKFARIENAEILVYESL